MNEEEFLRQYDQQHYDRPSIAVDMAVFSILKDNASNYRKLPKLSLAVLLIERGEHPFKNNWALPGGFVRKGETTEQAARRELQEETGIKSADLRQLMVFSDPQRDPRGWIISSSFTALTEMDCALTSGNDARQAKWFVCNFEKIAGNVSRKGENDYEISEVHKLSLNCRETKLYAIIKAMRKVSLYRQEISYSVMENYGLAFDHAKIIAHAVMDLRRGIERSADAFRFLPETFTLNSIQQVYETILGKKLLTANFRRKIAPYVLPTEQKTEARGHRSARLYKRNKAVFFGKNIEEGEE